MNSISIQFQLILNSNFSSCLQNQFELNLSSISIQRELDFHSISTQLQCHANSIKSGQIHTHLYKLGQNSCHGNKYCTNLQFHFHGNSKFQLLSNSIYIQAQLKVGYWDISVALDNQSRSGRAFRIHEFYHLRVCTRKL